MLRASEDREPCEMTPMRGTFFGCCASPVTATASNAPANRIDASAAFVNGRLIWTLFIMLDGSKERVIYEHHFSVAVSECSSIVSDENTGRHRSRPKGG